MRPSPADRARPPAGVAPHNPRTGYAPAPLAPRLRRRFLAAAAAAGIALLPAARAADVLPEAIRTAVEMETALETEAARYRPALDAVRRAREALPALLAAHAQALADHRPLWERQADYKRKLSLLDEHARLRGLAELAPDIARQENELRERRRRREAVGAAVTSDETEAWNFLAPVKAIVDAAQRDLPRARPAFVPAGADVAAYRAALADEFARFTAQIKPQQEELDRRAAALSAAAAAEPRAEQTVIAVRQRYLVLRHELHRRLAPAYLAEVKLRAPLDPRRDENVYYHAVIDEPEPPATDAVTAALVAALPAVDAEVARAFDEFQGAEARFKTVADRWQEKNQVYIGLTELEYLLHTGLELTEAMTAIATEGFSPTAVFFELGLRLKDAAQGEAAVPEPTLSEELLAYRARLAGELPPAGPAPAPPRPRDVYGPAASPGPVAPLPSAVVPGETGPTPGRFLSPLEEMRREIAKHETLSVTGRQIASNQFFEALEGAGGTVFGAMCVKLADKISLERFRGNMAAIMAAYALEGNFSGDVAANVANLVTKHITLRDAVAARPGDSMLQKLREPAKLGDIAKGFAISAALTVSKDGIKNLAGFTAERTRLVTEMALLDIEWFVRRAEYQTKGRIYRAYRAMQASYKAQIASLYYRQTVEPRRLRVMADKPFATVDRIQAELVFKGVVRDVDVRSADSGYSSSLDPGIRQAFTIPLYGSAPSPGRSTLAIQARGNVTRFDADPLTPARYAGPTLEQPAPTPSLWSQVETGPDRQHALRTEAPSLTVVDAGGRPFLPGDHVTVGWQLPGSLPYQRLRLTVREAGDDGPEVEIPAIARGTVQLLLPAEPGTNHLRLVRRQPDTGSAALPGAQATVVTIPPPVRALGGGPFTKATQTDLPSRGPAFRSGGNPAAGLGRLAFDTRGAGAQLRDPRISVRRAGSAQEVAYTYGGGHLDLPPGNYDAVIAKPVPVTLPGLRVAAGQTAIAADGGDGRVFFDVRDGVDAPVNRRVSVRRAGRKEELAYTYGGNALELPPGNYDIVIEGTPEIEHPGLAVAAGKQTTLVSSGYGRLQLDARNGIGQPSDPRVSVQPAGTGRELVYTYGGGRVDVPPGRYDVSYSGTPPIEFKGVTVEAGKTTTRMAAGYGRLRIHMFDAAGRRTDTRISVLRPGSEEELAYTYGGGFVDVPPGAYALAFAVDGKTVKSSATARPGAETTVNLRR